MKIVTVIGARPQFIKAATLSRLISITEGITEVLVHTGQHYDQNMSDVFFEELDIPKPNYNLGIGGGSHGQQTGQMLQEIEKVLLAEEPDYLLVYGDTNSTLAGALAASKIHIPVIHVEAGLRSFNKQMPEEQNRILTDHISDLLFTPTKTAVDNLTVEGITGDKVVSIGDVMYDAAIYYGEKAESTSSILEKLGVCKKSFILVTMHRAENTDNPTRLKEIFSNLESVAGQQKVVLPLHPRTKLALENINFDFDKSKILFTEPVGYIDMVMLEKNASLIITDSGGVQKEAYFHQVPCLTMRNETEWVELVENGYNQLILDPKSLVEMVNTAVNIKVDHGQHLYGKGDAANLIVNTIKCR